MSRISVGRSALTTAVAGSAIVGLVMLLVLAAISTGGTASSVSLRIGKPPFEWQVPAANRILSGGPLALVAVFLVFLLLSFAVFLMIGRRAARPIEEARRRQLEFAIDASHELRTPLTVVEGEASLALRRNRGADEYRLALEKILGEGRRMRHIVDDLMWLARAEADPVHPTFAEVDLAGIAAEAAHRFEAVAAAKHQRISFTSNGNTGPMLVSPIEWMERLAGVLLDNACRYTPEGGDIRVSTSETDDAILFTVEDSGPGIPEQEREKVFDRFHRVAAVAAGSGLGLAIGARVVAETGGVWKVGQSDLGGALLQVRWRRDRKVRRPAGRL
jgi:signal transduction histidine kinase